MRNRCTNEKHDQFAHYGGRGITICERWQSFENFLEDMGERPEGVTIDRFPDNNGNYEPGNCRWATDDEQGRNKRSNVLDVASACIIRYSLRRGLSRASLAREFGVSKGTIDLIAQGKTWKDPLRGLSGAGSSG